MQTMVFASLLIKSREGAPRLSARELEESYFAPGHGLKDVARIAAALGGIALYAGLLAAFAQ